MKVYQLRLVKKKKKKKKKKLSRSKKDNRNYYKWTCRLEDFAVIADHSVKIIIKEKETNTWTTPAN